MMVRVLLLLAACGSPWEESIEDGLRHLSGNFRTDGSGEIEVDFRVDEGETAFAAVAQATPLRTNLPRLAGPDGMLFEADTQSAYFLTNAGFVSPVSVLSWPILDGDPPVVEGEYAVAVGTLASEALAYEPGDFTVDVWLKSDPEAESGAVQVRLVWTAGLASSDSSAAFDAAFAIWEEVYAAKGLAVVRLADADWDGAPIGLPGETPEGWLGMSGEGPPRVVNLVVVESIDGMAQAYGLAGGIPGPPGATAASGVLVSLGLGAGVDGTFSALETRLLAETLAHETGHYLGLFHPVEIGWLQWDALDDTDACVTEATCEATFATNLMFPYPVCDLRACTPQDQLTGAQGRVANRHVLVD